MRVSFSPTASPDHADHDRPRVNTTTDTIEVEEEVAHYLATGESDPLGGAFPGAHALERITGYERHLRQVLLHEVQRRERGRRQPPVPEGLDSLARTRRKVRPMISGLFSAADRPTVLETAARSILFLTREATHRAIRGVPFLESAWKIANMYLLNLGAPMLSHAAQAIVGLSEETRCYVSMDYFREQDPFANYVVHEVAHIFHNCKRSTLGLPHSRAREWLLDIAFAKRETFAYACETYSRILEWARSSAQRATLFAKYAATAKNFAEGIERDELLDILREAVAGRNHLDPTHQPA